jgi:hypothetical protein
MLALDDELGRIYFKPYTLQGIGDKIEVWVADNLQFPTGDCRGTVSVTSDQVQELITQFDTNMYPKETATFSTPPDRDGSGGSSLARPSRAEERALTYVPSRAGAATRPCRSSSRR